MIATTQLEQVLRILTLAEVIRRAWWKASVAELGHDTIIYRSVVITWLERSWNLEFAGTLVTALTIQGPTRRQATANVAGPRGPSPAGSLTNTNDGYVSL